MNYTRLTEKKEVEIDILLKQELSMRKVGKILGISHSTISRYKNKKYKVRKQVIKPQYERFLKYLYEHYDWKNNSIEVCVEVYKKKYSYSPCVTTKQVYNWISQGKINIKRSSINKIV